MKVATVLIALLMSVTTAVQAAPSDHQGVLDALHVPPGFSVSIFADGLPTARSLAVGDKGVVYVGSRDGGVYAVQDQDGDGVAEKRYILAEKLYMPNGVAYKNGALYVAEVHRIIRFDGITEALQQPPKPVVVFDQFPTEQHHGWKVLQFGPDGRLYTAVGMPCNVCKPDKPLFGSLVRLNADGSHLQVLASGIRNSVGFAWEPVTGRLFFNDNGRDHLGDDSPADELNSWSHNGEDFGFPYCHAGTVADPQFGSEKACSQFKAPIWHYPAHVAPLGMLFYSGKQFPKHYEQQLLVAQHGSWNRSQPQGYQVALITMQNGLPVAEQPFISGWLQPDGQVLGRPVDVVQMPDGSILISDDKRGVIYKVSYGHGR
jgi:glucose/arabinose dehydrogenase